MPIIILFFSVFYRRIRQYFFLRPTRYQNTVTFSEIMCALSESVPLPPTDGSTGRPFFQMAAYPRLTGLINNRALTSSNCHVCQVPTRTLIITRF